MACREEGKGTGSVRKPSAAMFGECSATKPTSVLFSCLTSRLYTILVGFQEFCDVEGDGVLLGL